jgi:hypothetical protein
MSKFTNWFNQQPDELQQLMNRQPIYTWHEFIWTVATAFAVGVLLGLVF